RLQPDTARLALLDDALHADTLLDDMADSAADPAEHPLANQVTDRTLTDLLAWPITGVVPRALRGSDAPADLLGTGERDQLATDLREATERANGHSSAPMLRRQACFLLAGHQPSSEWVRDLTGTETRKAGDLSQWSPQWPVARSLAVSHAVLGDTEPLQRFIGHGLAHPDMQV